MIPGTIPAEFEFRSKFRRNHLFNLAGPSAKFDSSGILGIARIPPDSGWNQWRTIKTSPNGCLWGVGVFECGGYLLLQDHGDDDGCPSVVGRHVA